MIWVQQIDILYTKKSRGAPAATHRNSLPRAFAMHSAGEAAFSFEHYKLLEWKDFVASLDEAARASAVPRHQGDLVVNPAGDAVTLGLRWNQAIGQPPRRDQVEALTLSKGRTARLMINGRYTSHSGQVYTEATYNVAFGESIAVDVFLARDPDSLLDMRADLF
jgi:hypothetical protein